MSIVYVPVKKIYGRTAGLTHTKSRVPPIPFNANDQGLISWTMLGNGQQTGTPSPQSIIMPTFCGVRTANLTYSNATQTAGTILSISQTIGKSSFILNKAVTESSTSNFASVDIPLEAGTYTASVVGLNLLSTTHDRIFIRANDDTIIAQNIQTGNPVTFTLSAPTTLSKIVIVTAPQSTYNNTEIYFMLNTGGTALPYEPYGWAEKITCSGQTTPVYLGQVSTVRRVKKLVLDETADWSYYGTFGTDNHHHFFVDISPQFIIAKSNAPLLVCDKYDATIAVQDIGNYQCRYQQMPDATTLNIGRVYFTNDSYNSLQEIKEALAGNPIIIWVITTATTAIVNEPLCKIGDYADELRSTDAGVTIPTVNGANTISVDSTIPPSSLTIQYTSPDYSLITKVYDNQGAEIYST